jgi:hypothetical protein
VAHNAENQVWLSISKKADHVRQRMAHSTAMQREHFNVGRHYVQELALSLAHDESGREEPSVKTAQQAQRRALGTAAAKRR